MTARWAKAMVAVASAILLVGCTSLPGSPITRTPADKPSPTASVANAPQAALPLSCAQLFAAGSIQSRLHDAVSVKVDETHLAPLIQDLAVLQAGGTECVWGGEDMTDSTYETGVTVDILPDAAAAFAARTASADSTPVTGTLNPSSTVTCVSTGPGSGPWCDGDMLVGDYWISFIVDDIKGAEGSGEATVEAIMMPIATAVAKAGGSVESWARPPSPYSGASLCADPGASSVVSTALGATATLSNGHVDDGLPGAAKMLLGAAQMRAGMASCSWSSGGELLLTIDTLPAGAWAYPRLLSAPPLWTLIGRPTPFSAPNTDGALHACGDPCAALVSSHDSLVAIGVYSTYDQAVADAIVEKLTPAID